MLGLNTYEGRQRRDCAAGDGLEAVPESLRALVGKAERAIADLSGGADGRETMHALRSSVSDICALTQADPKMRRAVGRLVRAGERLAEAKIQPLRARAEAAALRAVRSLAHLLVDARPSRIAVSLGRGW
ncbi:hypothetical protein SQ03_19250 [Methylobacterium platani JCM 14648]|uniref:Uncharacterized protein n=2 Tax=Methylobacterium platani TaxID=427683 RepID=A0ABR5GWZ9_9HYPH|nr:hypothetical protein SQ03_19250 [Methylobacterium platani JCM 14648]